MKHQSQREGDSYFQMEALKEVSADAVLPFDFRRLDRIPKSQVSAIHQLHETFVRTLSFSLSAYLRSFVSGNLISVEQLPYSEFVETLPAPTCMAYFNMQPYEGHTLIEVNPSLISPILELVLGNNGKAQTELDREMTEVERDLIDRFYEIVAHDLRETWKTLVPVNFALTSIETRPQLSGRFVPTAAVVAMAIELRIGEKAGMVNVAIPSSMLRMMGQRFDQQWAVHKEASPSTENAIKERFAKYLKVTVDCELSGETIQLGDLLSLAPGDVFRLSPALNGPADILVNGRLKFKALMASGAKRRTAVIQ